MRPIVLGCRPGEISVLCAVHTHGMQGDELNPDMFAIRHGVENCARLC
jgi:hypothetical protein